MDLLPQVLHVDVDVDLPFVKIVQQEYTFHIALCGSPIGWLSNGKEMPLLFLGAICSQFEKNIISKMDFVASSFTCRCRCRSPIGKNCSTGIHISYCPMWISHWLAVKR